MHPDQFVLINSPKDTIFQSSIEELSYHCDVLDAMNLDASHKVQIHIGGVYGDKDQAIQRFIIRFNMLPEKIKKRLVIENDDRLFSVDDCMRIYSKTDIPILFDNFHHTLNNKGETTKEAARMCFLTWQKEKDGIPMVDYSSQDTSEGKRKGKHCEFIDIVDFKNFLGEIRGLDCDIMLEIKNKERSAQQALSVVLLGEY
jgi:UV DNA damage endonuclease